MNTFIFRASAIAAAAAFFAASNPIDSPYGAAGGGACAKPFEANSRQATSNNDGCNTFRNIMFPPVEMNSSKYVLQSKLDLPGSTPCRCDSGSLGIPSSITQKRTGIRQTKIRAVRQIKEFRPELHPCRLGEIYVLENGKIQGGISRTGQCVIAEISEMPHAVIRITRTAHPRACARRWDKLIKVVVLVRTTKNRTVIAAGDQIGLQPFRRKELCTLRRIVV